MEYCGPRGIPKSEFLTWSEDDQDAALAWVLDQSSRCNRCGSYTDEWMDEGGKPNYPPPMFAKSERCEGCVTLNALEEKIRTQNSMKLPTGMRVFLSRKPPPPRDDDDEFD